VRSPSQPQDLAAIASRSQLGATSPQFGIVQDITERKQGEENLRESEWRNREAQAELAHASRLTVLGELTASIAHEVDHPLYH
jgi:C4-dicarboxylate-specific signal transduction histidine kinase